MPNDTSSSARRCVRSVTERDILELDPALEVRLQTASAAGLLGLLVHDFAEHANRKRHFLILVDHGDDLDQRSGNTRSQHIEGDERADRHRAAEDVQRTETDDGHAHQLLDEAGERLGHGRNLFDPEPHRNGLGRLVVPYPPLPRLQRQRLHRSHAVNGFDEKRLALAFGLVESLQPAAGTGP